ncbi:hypothetical protein [Paraburkholderia antibiotica]|uniref:Uncharacterized protein n=1 Tax=Paraburkholderia antibiotica TaxID=2728839 RepID=A0A7Y0A1E4_9BURK|nr:hypothetical protein [Paraburkholderia antibiotica]NML34706.1 hypothetical protein [Paraburkholderia antibiotica]
MTFDKANGQRMKARIAAVAAILLSIGTSAWAAGHSISTIDAAANRAADITRTCRLSTNKTKCLLFDVSDHPGYFMVGVHEKHSPECGGDPGLAPALFFMKIRKRDGYVSTNYEDGEHFRPLSTIDSKQKCDVP